MPTRLLLFQSILLAVVLTWPAALHPTAAAVGSPNGDGLKHVWNLWWMRHELLEGTWGLRTTLINYPNGIDLYPIEFANGLLSAWLPLPPILVANLLAMLHVTLIGVCTGWLGWLVTGERRGMFAAGAAAQGSAFTAFTLHAGVGELRQAWWIPLGLALAVRARRDLARADFARLGLVVALATLACFYHGFFLATAVGVFALATARPERKLWFGWLGAAGLGLAIVVPTVKLFSSTYGKAEAESKGSFLAWMTAELPKDSFPVASLHLPELLTPDGTVAAAVGVPFEAYLGGRYIGVLGLLLAGLGVFAMGRRAIPWVAIALAGVVLAMGNLTWWGGEGGTPLLMPLAPVNRALEYFAQPLNFPVRYLSITSVALAVLVAAAAARFRWSLLALPLVLVDVQVNDPVAFPRSTLTLEGVADVVAPEGAVAEITWALKGRAAGEDRAPVALFDGADRGRSIAAQIHLDRAFETVPIERVDHWSTDGIDWIGANAVARVARGSAVPEDEIRVHLALLWRRGFRSVLVTHDCVSPGDLAAVARLDALLGKRIEGDCLSLWPLTEPPPLADPEAAERAYRVSSSDLGGAVRGPPVTRPTDQVHKGGAP